MTHGDPKNPKKNPHAVKRYEVTATADAPGPWDSVGGTVFFDVINNEDCVPRDSFTGGQNVPNTGDHFEMTRVDEKTWKGYFYRDALQDEDYFGMGVCHWDATGVGADFAVRGEKFNSSFLVKDFLEGPQISYFKKSDYGEQALVRYGAPNYSPLRPEYTQNPTAFFPVTISIKEIAP